MYANQNTAVLVLDVDFRPLRIEHWKAVISDFFNGKVEVIHNSRDRTIKTVGQDFPMPSVVRVLRRFRRDRQAIKFSRLNVYARDAFTCFGAGTRVLMANGRQQSIEDVHVGDRVIDAFGCPQVVVNTGSRIAENVVSIKHRGSCERTIVTADHRFLTSQREFIAVQDRPEMLVFPRNARFEKRAPEPLDVTSRLPADKWYRLRGGRVYLTKRPHEHGFPLALPCTPALAFLLGVYCADGSSSAKTGLVVFSLNTTTKIDLAPIIEKSLREFGLAAARDVHEDRHVLTVRAGSTIFATLLRAMCGTTAKTKCVPWDAIGPFHAEFIAGLFRGDGHIDRERHKAAYTTTSSALAFGLQGLLWGVGIFPTIQKIEREGKLAAWTLVLNAENYVRLMACCFAEGTGTATVERIFGDDEFVFRRLQEIEPIEGEHIVYDIEVAESHSFIANGLAVHNCQYCGERKMSEDLTFDHVVPRSQGGRTSWENIVSACGGPDGCNAKKANRTPQEAGMKLIRKPRKPRWLPTVTVEMRRDIPQEWQYYWSSTLES